MRCLHKLDINEFAQLIENRLKIKDWWIYKIDVNERLQRICETTYFQTLKDQAVRNNINAKNIEILSWIDTLNLMYYSLAELPSDMLNELHIKIIIIEFSFDKFGQEYKYETKLNQSIGYKELLTNLLPPYIEISTYTLLIEPESDACGNLVKNLSKYSNELKFPNYDKTFELGRFIEFSFQKNNYTAISEIEQLDCVYKIYLKKPEIK